MRFLALIALFVTVNASAWDWRSPEPGSSEDDSESSQACKMSLDDRLSQGLKRALRDEHPNTKLTVYLLTPENPLSLTLMLANLRRGPQSLRELLIANGIIQGVYPARERGFEYVEIRLPVRELRTVLSEILALEQRLSGRRELRWAGLARQAPEFAFSKPAPINVPYPQATPALRWAIRAPEVQANTQLIIRITTLSNYVPNIQAVIRKLSDMRGLELKTVDYESGTILLKGSVYAVRDLLRERQADVAHVDLVESRPDVASGSTEDGEARRYSATELQGILDRFESSDHVRFEGYERVGLRADAQDGPRYLQVDVVRGTDVSGRVTSFEGLEVRYRVLDSVRAQ